MKQDQRNNNSDQQLLDEFITRGDIETLGILYARYMHLVYGVCLKYFHDRERSGDLVMQIFEKLVVEVPKHDIRNFRSWLYVLTKNSCLMELRKEKARSEKEKIFFIEQGNFMESGAEMHPVDEDPEKWTDALRDCISRLKAEQKACIELFYYKDKCYREIADILELDEKKVKSFLQNGKRNLKICLEKYEVEQ